MNKETTNHLNDAMDQLNDVSKHIKPTLDKAKLNVNQSINNLINQVAKNGNTDDIKKIQTAQHNINKLMDKALKGENIDAEIKRITKQFKPMTKK